MVRSWLAARHGRQNRDGVAILEDLRYIGVRVADEEKKGTSRRAGFVEEQAAKIGVAPVGQHTQELMQRHRGVGLDYFLGATGATPNLSQVMNGDAHTFMDMYAGVDEQRLAILRDQFQAAQHRRRRARVRRAQTDGKGTACS